MTTLITNEARAYVNFGRWIADCPTDCGSALKLEPGQGMFQCVECFHICSVDWPANAEDIWDTLAKRPAPKHRNWFPSQHELALRSNCPHGQTVAELEEETAENLKEK